MSAWNPADHPPGGNPENRGEFSAATHEEYDGESLAAHQNWPAVDREKLEWRSKIASFGVRGAEPGSESGTYYASIPPFIANRKPMLSGETLLLLEDTMSVISGFDASLGGEIAPFSSILLRSEAVASSRIENLTASARAVLTAEAGLAVGVEGGSGRQNADVIARNTATMRAALNLADDISVDTILVLHAELMTGDTQHVGGEWRHEPVWIGTSGLSPFGATYVAPSFERIPELMDDLVAFAQKDDLPRLARIALTHAQFETIHPFTDGNGRTGRALMHAMLKAQRVTKNVTVPVSAGLLADTTGYHADLMAYRRGDIEPIIRRTAESALLAIENANTLVDEIHEVQASWRAGITARSDSNVWPALEVIAKQPVISAAALSRELGVSSVTAYNVLNDLTERRILKVKTEYKIGKLWRSDDVLGALDRFAARAGRRG